MTNLIVYPTLFPFVLLIFSLILVFYPHTFRHAMSFVLVNRNQSIGYGWGLRPVLRRLNHGVLHHWDRRDDALGRFVKR